MSEPVSRRAFFRQAAGTTAASAVSSPLPSVPAQAWIIVALGWEYNDEFTYPDGCYPESKVYFDRQVAETECRRLCDEFFVAQSPQEFEADFASYDVDPETGTWSDLQSAGFPDPFYVQELES